MVYFLFILLGCIALSSMFPPKDHKTKLFLYYLGGIILILSAAFREGWFDYNNYIQAYEDIITGVDVHFEVSYKIISLLSNWIYNDVIVVFIIYAILGVTLKLIAIKQLTKLWGLSLLIYISNFFILHELTQMRAGIASAFLLLSIKPIYDRNLKRFLFISLCAFFFHYSALIILPFWFLNRTPLKSLLILSVPVGYLISFLSIMTIVQLIPIAGVQQKIEIYIKWQQLGISNEINIFNMLFLAKIVIFYLLVWKIDLLSTHNKYTYILINIYAFALFAFPAFSAMPVISFRIHELAGVVEIILFPLLYYLFKPKMISKLIVIFIGLTLFSIAVFYVKLIY